MIHPRKAIVLAIILIGLWTSSIVAQDSAAPENKMFLSNYSSEFPYDNDEVLSQGDSIYHAIYFTKGLVYFSIFHLPPERKDKTIYPEDIEAFKQTIVEHEEGFSYETIHDSIRFSIPVIPDSEMSFSIWVGENDLFVTKHIFQYGQRMITYRDRFEFYPGETEDRK